MEVNGVQNYTGPNWDIIFCIPQKSENYTGLERHGWVNYARIPLRLF